MDTNDGSITFDAGGSITALDVESATDHDDNDITLHNTSGDILVDRVNAGTVAGDIILTSDSGNIDEFLPEDTETNLIGDHAVLTADLGIGGLVPLETELNSLEAYSRLRGNIDLNELDAIMIDSVVSNHGSIEIDAHGTITARHVESVTDDAANTITLHNTVGDILLDRVIAQRDFSNVFLTSDAGGIDSLSPGDSGVDLQGNHAVISAFDSIGGIETIDTELNSIAATVADVGDIDLHEATSITVDLMSTSDGRVDLLVNEDANIDLLTTGRDQGGNDVFIRAGEDLNVNRIFSGYDTFTGNNPAVSTTVTLKADRILEWKTDPEVDIRAASLDFEAGRDIGTLSDPIETSARQITSTSGAGSNAINNYATGKVTVTNFSSINGSLFFEQFNGEITLNSVNAGLGNITLVHNGTENMIIDDLVTGGGNVDVTVRDAGRLQIFNTLINGDASFRADELDYRGEWKSISGTQTLSILTDNPTNGIFVSPYKIALDTTRILEYDLIRDRRDNYPLTFFTGNVLFDLPPTDLSSGGQDVGGGALEESADSGKVFAVFGEMPGGGNMVGGGGNGSPGSSEDSFARGIGFSMSSLSSSSGSLREAFSSGALSESALSERFSAHFGYRPMGLESLLPDLFDDLTETLSGIEEPAGEAAGASGRNGPTDPADSVETEIVVTRGEEPEVVSAWEGAEDDGRFRGALLPLALAGVANGFKKCFRKRNDRNSY